MLAISQHVSLSGYNDVAIFKDVANNSELTQTSYVIIVSLKSEPMVKLIKRIQGERQSFNIMFIRLGFEK